MSLTDERAFSSTRVESKAAFVIWMSDCATRVTFFPGWTCAFLQIVSGSMNADLKRYVPLPECDSGRHFSF